MSTISLESSIRTCKVDTSYANKIESDRFLNPQNMVCPTWHGYDSAGRPACLNSYNNKSRGCHSAVDRVSVENDVSRPQYVTYLPLDVAGIKGDIYGTTHSSNLYNTNNNLRAINEVTGNFGGQRGATTQPGCGTYSYKRAMAQEAQSGREQQSSNSVYSMQSYKTLGGY